MSRAIQMDPANRFIRTQGQHLERECAARANDTPHVW